MSTTYTLGPLYDLLSELYPHKRNSRGTLDVAGVGEELGVTRQHLYGRFRSPIPAELAFRIALSQIDRMEPDLFVVLVRRLSSLTASDFRESLR